MQEILASVQRLKVFFKIPKLSAVNDKKLSGNSVIYHNVRATLSERIQNLTLKIYLEVLLKYALQYSMTSPVGNNIRFYK